MEPSLIYFQGRETVDGSKASEGRGATLEGSDTTTATSAFHLANQRDSSRDFVSGRQLASLWTDEI